MRPAGAELHVVAHHQNRHAAREERLHDGGKRLLELRVEPLCRLVHEQDVRLQQQHLRQCRALLLAAGEVIRVPVEQLRQAAKRHDLLHALLLCLLGQLLPVEHLEQVFADGLFHEQRLRILRQYADAPRVRHAPAVGLEPAREQAQARALARAVAA